MSERRRTHVVAAAIVVDGRCLIGRRPPGGSAGELWEFPGGKVELGETPEAALMREIQEELGVAIDVGPLLGSSSIETAERILVLDLYLATWTSGELERREHLELDWASADLLESFSFAPADQPLLPVLGERLRLNPQKTAAPPRKE
jgi:8-oxo-dGTP diphosphatase